jgi:hypothetical protein
MATAVYSDPSYYKKAIPAKQAQQVAARLGISTDQLFQYFGQLGDPNAVKSITAQQTGPGTYAPGGTTTQVDTSGIERMKALQTSAATQQQAFQTALAQQQALGRQGAPPVPNSSYLQSSGANPLTYPSGNLPEQNALAELAKIDPTSEAMRTALGKSYLTNLNQSGAAPTAAQLQSYLDTYKTIDPQTYAAMQGLGGQYTGLLGGEDQQVKFAQQQAALGTSLDPQTMRELEQSTRQAQSARGNIYGTPQMVAESMTRGQAGMAIQQQRQQALATALGAKQSGLGAYQGYLTSGFTPGATALNMYQQQLANQNAARSSALSYLGSGQTPYQAGAGYLSGAETGAANAATAPSYQYNPQNLGLGASFTNPQAGQQTSQSADQWFNSFSNLYGMTPATKNKAGAALGGAVSGAAAGIPLAGPTYGGSILAGAALGGASGYFS